MRVKTFLTMSAIAVFSFSALADDGHNNNNNNNNNGNNSFQSSVVGSAPGLVFGGISSGGVPWVVTQGQASVSSNGRVTVQVQGLLLAATGATPVAMVGATLVCGGAAVPEAVAVTPSPLSSLGNAEISQDVTLPAACFGPVVLVRVFNPTTTQLSAFIAATGLAPGAAQNPDQSEHGGGGSGH